MKVSWIEEECSIEEALLRLNFSKSLIKKSGLKRSDLNKKIKERSTIQLPSELFNRGEIFPLFEGKEEPRILAEEEDILALSKPSYLHCHPLSYNEGDNLLSFLREKNLFSFLKVNKSNYDRGLLYRLDYETSGLTLLTKSEDLYQDFRKTHREAEKWYQVVIKGEYRGLEVLEHKMTTSGVKVRIDPLGKAGRLEVHGSHYHQEKGLSLLQVKLIGGLRHQIRVQMAEVGHPLVGDTLYGGIKAERFGLHCFRYQWKTLAFEDSSFSLELFK